MVSYRPTNQTRGGVNPVGRQGERQMKRRRRRSELVSGSPESYPSRLQDGGMRLTQRGALLRGSRVLARNPIGIRAAEIDSEQETGEAEPEHAWKS